MKNTGKRYNEEFRADILRLIREEKRSVSSIEKDFGVNDQTVRNWLKESNCNVKHGVSGTYIPSKYVVKSIHSSHWFDNMHFRGDII